MEVLNDTKMQSESEGLGGQSLIQTIVSLTELPEPLVHHEMNEILQAAGHQSDSLTLEQLRSAMLCYLEAIQADLGCDNSMTPMPENDAALIKTPVILE